MIHPKTEGRLGQTHLVSSRCLLRWLLTLLGFTSTGTLILVYHFFSPEVIDLQEGQVAPQNISAPHQMEYVSDLKTAAARERARASVAIIYKPPNPKIARQQVDRLRQIFDYLEAVRADPYGSLAAKSEWVAAIPELTLSDIVVDKILIMNDQTWTETRQAALLVLEKAMSTEIKESQILTARRQLPTHVPLSIPDDQSEVIVAMTEDLISPNTFPDEAQTKAKQEEAAALIKPIKETLEKGELIISAGQIVTAENTEALHALRTRQQLEANWIQDFVTPVALMLLSALILGAYLVQYAPHILMDSKQLTLLAVLLLIFIALAKLMLPGFAPTAYLYPIGALAILVAILIDPQLTFLITPIIAFLAGHLAATPILVIYLIIGGWTAALALGRGQRLNAIMWAGGYTGAVNVCLLLIFNLSTETFDLAGLGFLILEGLLNGILLSAGVALIGLFLIGSLVGIITPIHLLDFDRPTHPLLRQLLLKAPGTYHHSLMVGNLGEQAAERIGANSSLVRVMASYHDIGKIHRPYFFIENQPAGSNVHEKLDPQISAQIIISHVKDGLDLAHKYHLPQVIKDGIAQHHGTSQVRFFYYQALQQAEETGQKVHEADFSYPGPKPQSKETGILMLADVSESTVRAIKPGSAAEIDEIVQKVIFDKLNSGELDECNLTIADLYQIRTAFVDILQGVHHPRIKYPDPVKAQGDVVAEEAPKKPTPVATPASLRPVHRSATLIRRE